MGVPVCYRAVALTSQGGVASLNFDATELKNFYGNLGSPSNPNLQYEFYGVWQLLATRHRTPYLRTKLWTFL